MMIVLYDGVLVGLPALATQYLQRQATQLRQDTVQSLTVRPEPVEGWAVKPIMVRQAHHERLNLKLSRLKWVAQRQNW